MTKTMKTVLGLLLVAMLAVTLVACDNGSGETTTAPSTNGGDTNPATQPSGDAKTLIVGHVLDAEHPVHLGYVEMDRVLQELSGGAIVLEIFPNSALGDEVPMMEALRTGGSIDFTAPSATSAQPFAKEYIICDFPYSFANYDQVWAYYDGEVGDYLFGKVEPSGIKGLSWWDNGFRNFTTTDKAIHEPNDLKGLKIRTMSAPGHMAIVNAMGGTATPVPYAEVYSALQQGVVDGQENPVANIYGAKFYEVQKYITMDRHVHDPSPAFVSVKTWNALSEDEQKWVQEASDKAATYMRQVSIDDELGKLDFMRDYGTEVIELTDAQVLLFQEATKDVYKDFVSDAGQEAIDLYLKGVEEARKVG